MRILILLLLLVGAALARDDGRYSNVDPVIKNWIEGLRDNRGYGCCSTADGIRLDDPEWTCTDAEHCRVKLDGAWHDVPESALLKESNRLGYPIVWRLYRDGKPIIRCFLRGAQS